MRDVAAKQGLAEQKGRDFSENLYFPRQYAKNGNRVCKSLPRLVFSFTAKKIEVQFSKALYKVDKKKVRLLKSRSFEGGVRDCRFVPAKNVARLRVLTRRAKGLSRILTHPIEVGSEFRLQLCLPQELRLGSLMTPLESAEV